MRSQVVSFVCGVVDGQQGAQVAHVGICSVLKQDVDTVWISGTCCVVQDAVAIRCLGVDVSTFMQKQKTAMTFLCPPRLASRPTCVSSLQTLL